MLVVCGVLIENGKYFLAQRPSYKNLPNHWEFPGGKVEPNELPEEALIRELKEELNIDIKVGRYLVEVSNDIINLRAFLIKTKPNSLFQLNEHQRMGWFSLAEIERLQLGELDQSIIQFLRK